MRALGTPKTDTLSMICLLFLEADNLLSTNQKTELLPLLIINKTPF